MKAYIDKTAVVAEIEKRLHKERFLKKNVHDAYTFGLESVLKFLDTLEVKEINNVWHDTRRTIPEDGSEQIICIKEDGLAVSTVGKIVNGTIKWAYLNDLLNISDVQVKEVEEEPVSEDLGEAANTYVDNWYKLNNLDKESYPIDVEISKNDFKAGAKWQKEQMITKACNYLFSHMGLFVTFFDDDIVEDIEKSEFIKKFRIAMEDKT